MKELLPDMASLTGISYFDHAPHIVVNRCQTNIMYIHDVVEIRASEETNHNAKSGVGVDEISALVLLPIASTTQKEYPLKLRF